MRLLYDRWRKQVNLAAAIVVVGVVLFACAAEERHRVLTMLFDGVPPMEDSQEPTATDEGDDGLPPLREAESRAFLASADVKAASVSLNHATFATDCNACHGEGRAVSDDRCTVCHTPRVHQKSIEAPMTCGACHVEHQGRLVDITKANTAMCMECHDEDPFEDYHPEFALVESPTKALAAVRETGLWFIHTPHAGDDASECMTCHVPNETDDSFHPPTYDANCMDCHEVEVHKGVGALNWNELRSKLGEGEPDAVLQPNRPWSAAKESATEPMLVARKAIEDSDLGDCVDCHWLADRESYGTHYAVIADANPSYDWYKHVRFSHRAHAYQQCTNCHQVPSAADERAGRLMLPSKDKCAECHHDGGAPNTCANCHTYHKRTPDFGNDPQKQQRAIETLRLGR